MAAVLHRVPYQEGRNATVALAGAASRMGAGIVYLANPDNPTGSVHRASDVLHFIHRLPSGRATGVLHEAYAGLGAAGPLAGH